MIDHSQSGEQATVLSLLGDRYSGRVLDIGAYDGAVFSNSRALLERGWGGVLVEPEPAAFLKLHTLYRGRDDVQLINAAVGVGWYLSRFWRTADLVSTTDEDHQRKWVGAATYTGMYYVPTMPIATLFIEPAFDFVNIDTEGTSAELGLAVLRLPERLQPRAYCIEHDGRARELAEVGSSHGFGIKLLNAENVILGR